MAVDIPLTVTPPAPPPSIGVIVTSVVMAAVSVLAGGGIGLVGLVFFGGGALVLVVARRRPELLPGTRAREAGRLVLDHDGARVTQPGGAVEAIRWQSLTGVDILTTDDGPFAEDLYWLLHDGEAGCAIPGGAAVRARLLDVLAPLGLDPIAVIEASGSVTPARFTCWRGAPGDALPVGEALEAVA